MTEVAPVTPANVAALQAAPAGLGAPAAPATPAPPATPAAPATAPEGDLFPRSYVEQLRAENAAARIQARDAATTVREAVLGEVQPTIDAAKADATRLQDELGTAWIGQAKLESALVAVLGEESANKVSAFANALQGVDEASIKSSAASLKTLFGLAPAAPSATDPSQGQGQRGLTNPAQDPILRALTEASNRR